MPHIFPENCKVWSPDCELFKIPNSNLFQSHQLCLARTEQSFFYFLQWILPSFVGELNRFPMALQWYFCCLKKFFRIRKSGSTKCCLIFSHEGLIITLKRRITFPITNETEYSISVTLPNIQAKCFMSKLTVETQFLFVILVISTLSLPIIIQKRFLSTNTSMFLVRWLWKLLFSKINPSKYHHFADID